MMKYEIRLAEAADFTKIQSLYAGARKFMALRGNPNQWGNNWPEDSQIQEDIQEKCLFVLEDVFGIHGVFALIPGDDPTYATIINGQWSKQELYATIHRIAGDGSGQILASAVEYAQEQHSYLRIDTHEDNIPMQNAIKRLGFRNCGIIFTRDGSARLAFDK